MSEASRIGSDFVRGLTERLVATASVSPHPAAENACADVLAGSLPAAAAQGRLWTADHRAIHWAHVAGTSRRVSLLLGHHDTVEAGEFAALGRPEGAAIAFAPARLRDALLAHAERHGAPESVVADLDEERERPGTWMFGRGALDMKSGLAAAAAALHALAAGEAPRTGVLFASCPDEEADSAGMRAFAEALPRWLSERGLEMAGVLNTDFTLGPHAHEGAMGKLRALLWVIGTPTHVGAPFAGVDAALVAAALARELPLAAALADGDALRSGPSAAVLRLRDLKERYDVQTAREAVLELNVLTMTRGPDAALLAVRDAACAALETLAKEVRARAGAASAWTTPPPVLTFGELVAAAGGPEAARALGDPSALALTELRALARRAAITGPCVVVALLPPFYPHAAAGGTEFSRAIGEALADSGIPIRGAYPFITDAALVAGDARLAAAAARWTPEAMRHALPAPPLGAPMVNVGPWGRDAHGLWERVRCDWAFERLPALLVRLLREV